MSDPRWSDADPRPLYRDEQRPPARRQPLPPEHGRGRSQRSDWDEPDSRDNGRDDRITRGQGPPARGGDTRPRWGALPGVLGVSIVVGGAAVGALVSAVTSSQPGIVLSVFLIGSTVGAVLAVQPRKVYTIIPVPALAYLVASVMTGLAVNQNGTTLTALAVGAAQWIASGFVSMIIATVIAIAATIIRWPRNHGIRGPRRPPRTPSGRSHRSQDSQPRRPQDDRPRRPQDDRPRRPQEPRPRRPSDRRADSVATASFREWYREGRSG